MLFSGYQRTREFQQVYTLYMIENTVAIRKYWQHPNGND